MSIGRDPTQHYDRLEIGRSVQLESDIDLLAAAVRSGSSDTEFAVTGDGNVNSSDYDFWLDKEFEGKEKLQEMLRPYPAREMDAYRINTLVNNPKNDVAKCIERIDA